VNEDVAEVLASHPNWRVLCPVPTGSDGTPDLEDPAVAGWIWHTVKAQLPRGSVMRVLCNGKGETVDLEVGGKKRPFRHKFFEGNDESTGVLAARTLLWLWSRR
jgi:hypothetical protein|tara:strand:- start:14269 stop:14580 length:312 start_codon:yes stop_codon:yes gene_type:complete